MAKFNYNFSRLYNMYNHPHLSIYLYLLKEKLFLDICLKLIGNTGIGNN